MLPTPKAWEAYHHTFPHCVREEVMLQEPPKAPLVASWHSIALAQWNAVMLQEPPLVAPYLLTPY